MGGARRRAYRHQWQLSTSPRGKSVISMRRTSAAVVVALTAIGGAAGAATTTAQHFSGRTSQNEPIRFTYHAKNRVISDIYALLWFTCDGGVTREDPYGGFSVRVKPDGTFALVTSAGHFRGHKVGKSLIKGQISLALPPGSEPSGCTTGEVQFTARAASHRRGERR